MAVATGVGPRRVKVDKNFNALVIRRDGIFAETLDTTTLDEAARHNIKRYNGRYILFLVEGTGNPDGTLKACPIPSPDGQLRLTPQQLWRATKRTATRMLWSHRRRSWAERLQQGLGIAFLVICLIFLFLLTLMIIG